MQILKNCLLTLASTALFSSVAMAQNSYQQNGCAVLPNQAALKTALSSAVATETSGLNNHAWGVIVDRDGIVCAVAFSGTNRGSQFPGSRVVAATKANTANSFSLDSTSSSAGSGQTYGLALSTANLYSGTQPGGSLFGLEASNPVNPEVAYAGPSSNFGTAYDPMVGQKIGGIAVIGGGLALYDKNHNIVGGVGVSGDTACGDHNISWRVRHALGLDHMAAGTLLPVGGVSGDPAHPDNIIFDIVPNMNGGTGVSPSGFGHPACLNSSAASVAALPAVIQ
jgi:uncharacterized protein GlcG (DUF336 family)